MIHKYDEFLESNETTPEEILRELTIELSDIGLIVNISDKDNRFRDGYKLFLSIEDRNKVLCKNYPMDDMDWLSNKPVMMQFYKDIKDSFDLTQSGDRGKGDYDLFGGGTGVTLAFTKKGIDKLKL